LIISSVRDVEANINTPIVVTHVPQDEGKEQMRRLRIVFVPALILLACAACAFSQDGVTGLQRSSRLDLSHPSDGKPNLSGVWEVLNTAAWDIQDHQADTGIPPGQGVVEGNEIPYQPALLEQKKQNFANRKTEDTDVKCYLPGVPRVTYMPYPFQIVQTPKKIIILYEYIHIIRSIPLDGSPHPPVQEGTDLFMGDSRGHWDRDVVVVDVVNFNDRTWFDKVGDFHSDALHVIERYSFMDKDHLNYEALIDDPKVFTRPWKMSMPLYRRVEKNVRPLEYDCYAFQHLFHVPESAGTN
jgi:hypothetical protein